MGRSKGDLLDAAGDFLSRTGFQGTSMEDIASAIGVPRAALYYHFGNKGNLLAEILLGLSRESLDIVHSISAYPISAVDRLTLVVRALITHNLTSPAADLARAHHVDSPLLNDDHRSELMEVRVAIDGCVRRLLEEAIGNGSMRPVNVPIVANLTLTAIGRVPTWFHTDGPLTADDVAAIYADLLLRGLDPQGIPGPHSVAPSIDARATK